MPRPKAVPPSDSRESPNFWMEMISADTKRRQLQNEQFARYARWHRGDLRDVIDPEAARGERWANGLENMTSLATQMSLADLLFRWPRFVVRPPYASQHPLFSPELARVEMAYLTHTLRAVGYRRKARRCLQDALLGGLGVMRVTVDNEVAVDEDTLDEARVEAQKEVVDFLSGNFKALDAREDQIHSVHIEMKSQVLSQGERGEIPLPKSALTYLRKHIQHHEKMKGSERPTEMIRASIPKARRINPLDYFYDPTCDDRTEASWRADRYLLRKSDILANEDFDLEARKAVTELQDRWQMRTQFSPRLSTPGTYDIPEEMVMVYQAFDFVDQKRRLFVEGADIMLIQEERGDLATLQPSGPYHELAFIEDTFEGQAIPPPAAFEGEQSAATHIAVTNVAAVLQSSPRTLYDERFIKPDDAAKVWDLPVGHMGGVNVQGALDKKLSDMFDKAPGCEIPEQNMAVLADLRRGVDKRSGLGTSKMGGGEQASTATGAALGAEASTAISDDRASTVDEWIEGTARAFIRLTRRYTPKASIVEVCGPEAGQVWPQKWGLSDAANDIGVDVIPGSSRRNNTSIDQKQLLDGLGAFMSWPGSQTPAGTSMVIEMFRRFFDDGGVAGLDWATLDEEAKMQAMMQQMQAQMMGVGGQPEGGDGGGGGAPNPDGEGRSTDVNDDLQGVANVAGGQVPTGASIGDRVRQQRGDAVSNVANRV